MLPIGPSRTTTYSDSLPGVSIPEPPNYRTEVDHARVKCDENKFFVDKVEYWNAQNQLVRLAATDVNSQPKFSEFTLVSSFATLQGMFCGRTYAGLGFRFNTDGAKVKVAEVFAGSPAEKAGIKVDDVIAKIDGDLVNGLTAEEVISKTRGVAGSTVTLSILRGGQVAPLDMLVTRENIQQPQFGTAK